MRKMGSYNTKVRVPCFSQALTCACSWVPLKCLLSLGGWIILVVSQILYLLHDLCLLACPNNHESVKRTPHVALLIEMFQVIQPTDDWIIRNFTYMHQSNLDKHVKSLKLNPNSPLQDWNFTPVYAYLMLQEGEMNISYHQGPLPIGANSVIGTYVHPWALCSAMCTLAYNLLNQRL